MSQHPAILLDENGTRARRFTPDFVRHLVRMTRLYSNRSTTALAAAAVDGVVRKKTYGAGKTTIVRTLGTLIAPTSGSATVAGTP